MLKILMLLFQILSAKVLFFLEICKKKKSHCKVLSPILEEICPIRIFLIKDFALFGGQVVRVVCKQIEHDLLVKREQVLPYTIHIAHPINFIGFLILIEIVLTHTFPPVFSPPRQTDRATTLAPEPQGYCLGCGVPE